MGPDLSCLQRRQEEVLDAAAGVIPQCRPARVRCPRDFRLRLVDLGAFTAPRRKLPEQPGGAPVVGQPPRTRAFSDELPPQRHVVGAGGLRVIQHGSTHARGHDRIDAGQVNVQFKVPRVVRDKFCSARVVREEAKTGPKPHIAHQLDEERARWRSGMPLAANIRPPQASRGRRAPVIGDRRQGDLRPRDCSTCCAGQFRELGIGDGSESEFVFVLLEHLHPPAFGKVACLILV